MRFGSVCSGIEAASTAWHPLGWRASFLSEIEAFPRAVLSHHYPETPLHGDFTTIKAGEYEPIDLLVGGTPCQSFSVAGLRGGLDDDRGNLALEYLRLADRLRPRWLVWENVPGVLSSAGGRDFGAILGGMVELGYGVSYRVLDAQFFGVAQRRRRVFVVGHLGDWRCAAAVLFERHGLQGNPSPRRPAGQGFTHDVAPNLTGSGRGVERAGETRGQDPVVAVRAYGFANVSDGSAARNSEDLAPPMTLRHGDPGCVAIPLLEIGKGTSSRGAGPNGSGLGSDGDPMFTLQAGAQHGIAVALRGREGGAMLEIGGDTSNALRTPGGGASVPMIATPAVRRLTPRECERLQGFPDDYTLIPWRNGMASDGPRYKALGNSMAVPVMAWIGRRIQAVEALQTARAA